MPRPRPKALRAKPPPAIRLRPLQPRTRPLHSLPIILAQSGVRVLECLVRELLVVRDEFNGEQSERYGGEDVVRGCKLAGSG